MSQVLCNGIAYGYAHLCIILHTLCKTMLCLVTMRPATTARFFLQSIVRLRPTVRPSRSSFWLRLAGWTNSIVCLWTQKPLCKAVAPDKDRRIIRATEWNSDFVNIFNERFSARLWPLSSCVASPQLQVLVRPKHSTDDKMCVWLADTWQYRPEQIRRSVTRHCVNFLSR